MRELLLAIDQGTSGCKLTVFDLDGLVIWSTTKVYETFYPQPGYVEQNPQEWWSVIVEGIREMVDSGTIEPQEIKGIGIDGTSWACIPIDKSGNVLRPAMIWLDRRAEAQAKWMKDKVGEDLLISLCGNPVDPAYITPKILWMKDNEAELFCQTDKFLQSNAYIAYQLTGEVSQDHSQGYGFHFYNMSEGVWDQTVAEKLGISLDLMAPLRACHDIVGGVTREVAQTTGLLAGTPVVAGGLDAACCTLGAGVIHEGETQEQGGQAGGMSIAMKRPKIHPRLILGCHAVPGLWLLQGGTTGGGGTLNWFNREFGHKEQQEAAQTGINSFAIMSQEAQGIEPGSDGVIFLPYMKGERSPLWNSKAKGVYYGLGFEKTRAHMIRSTMEGVACSLRHNLETALEVDAQVDRLVSVGGSANSSIWTQIKSDITGLPIDVPFADHATTLGAAILAGVGVGLYENFEAAVARTVRIQKRYTPNLQNQDIYAKQYNDYLKLSHLLSESFWV